MLAKLIFVTVLVGAISVSAAKKQKITRRGNIILAPSPLAALASGQVPVAVPVPVPVPYPIGPQTSHQKIVIYPM